MRFSGHILGTCKMTGKYEYCSVFILICLFLTRVQTIIFVEIMQPDYE